MDCANPLKERTALHANAFIAVRGETHARALRAAQNTRDAFGNDALFIGE